MKDRISELMDGELEDGAAAQLIATLGTDREARDAWGRYHLIGDAMRDTRILSKGFTARLSEKLQHEPAVLAPRVRNQERRFFAPVPLAASFAAVALVGWVTFAPQQSARSP